MNQNKPVEKRFPYMFEGKNIGISIARGWKDLFVKLCVDIDRALGPDKLGFHWVQVKEKFGSARFYWEMKGGSPGLKIDLISESGHVTSLVKRGEDKRPQLISEQIGALVDAAARKTQSLCIVCGQPGAANTDEPYVLVLCSEHAVDRRAGRLQSSQIWGEETDDDEANAS